MSENTNDIYKLFSTPDNYAKHASLAKCIYCNSNAFFHTLLYIQNENNGKETVEALINRFGYETLTQAATLLLIPLHLKESDFYSCVASLKELHVKFPEYKDGILSLLERVPYMMRFHFPYLPEDSMLAVYEYIIDFIVTEKELLLSKKETLKVNKLFLNLLCCNKDFVIQELRGYPLLKWRSCLNHRIESYNKLMNEFLLNPNQTAMMKYVAQQQGRDLQAFLSRLPIPLKPLFSPDATKKPGQFKLMIKYKVLPFIYCTCLIILFSDLLFPFLPSLARLGIMDFACISALPCFKGKKFTFYYRVALILLWLNGHTLAQLLPQHQSWFNVETISFTCVYLLAVPCVYHILKRGVLIIQNTLRN